MELIIQAGRVKKSQVFVCCLFHFDPLRVTLSVWLGQNNPNFSQFKAHILETGRAQFCRSKETGTSSPPK
jgi:hypothetical protein